MAKTVYQEWFVKFRFPNHENFKMVESELGLIPEGWEVKELCELYNTSLGVTPSRKINEYYDYGNINWVKTKELKDNFIFETEEQITEIGLKKSSAKMFPINTVLIAMYGATIGRLGILANPATTNQACCAILNKIHLFEHSYIFLYLLENREKIFSLGMGAAQQNISQQVIKKFLILKPTNQIMKSFNKNVNPLLEMIKVLQRKNDNLRKTRDLLLPKLISGEIDVENLDINTERLAS